MLKSEHLCTWPECADYFPWNLNRRVFPTVESVTRCVTTPLHVSVLCSLTSHAIILNLNTQRHCGKLAIIWPFIIALFFSFLAFYFFFYSNLRNVVATCRSQCAYVYTLAHINCCFHPNHVHFKSHKRHSSKSEACRDASWACWDNRCLVLWIYLNPPGNMKIPVF